MRRVRGGEEGEEEDSSKKGSSHYFGNSLELHVQEEVELLRYVCIGKQHEAKRNHSMRREKPTMTTIVVEKEFEKRKNLILRI
jgi:hypothetical protein